MDSLRFFALQQLKVQAIVQLVMRNKAVEGFFRASPAVRPSLFLYQLWHTVEHAGPRGKGQYDLIICDLPTSGFVAGMYAIPGMLAGVFRAGPLAGYAEGMRAMLVDRRRTGLTLVTLPEEMPVVEALELRALLKSKHGVEPAAMVVNAVMPRAVDADVLDALERASDHDPAAVEPWLETASRIAQRRGRALAALHRLRDALPPDTVLTLPWRFERELNLAAIDALGLAMRDGDPAATGAISAVAKAGAP